VGNIVYPLLIMFVPALPQVLFREAFHTQNLAKYGILLEEGRRRERQASYMARGLSHKG
jgi:hypothetical protein